MRHPSIPVAALLSLLIGLAHAGQLIFELKANTPRQLYVAEVDALLDFSAEEGKAASLTLPQGGQKLLMQRKQ